MTDKVEQKRVVSGIFVAIPFLLVLTFDHVWNQPDAAFVAGWLMLALLPLLAVAYQCALSLARSLRLSTADRSLDTVFWIVFLVLPSVLWGSIWVCSYLWYLLTAPHLLVP